MGADLRLTSAAAVMPLWPSPLKRGKGNQKKKEKKKREREKETIRVQTKTRRNTM